MSLHRTLATLGVRDGLALVVGPAVSNQQVSAVDRKQRVACGSRSLGRSGLVHDINLLDVLEGSRVRRVFIGSDDQATPFGSNQFDEICHGDDERLGVRSSDPSIEFSKTLLLCCGRAALTAEFSLGEGVPEVGVSADGEVDVVGEVLAEFEGLKAIDHDGLQRRMLGAQPLM